MHQLDLPINQPINQSAESIKQSTHPNNQFYQSITRPTRLINPSNQSINQTVNQLHGQITRSINSINQ